MTLVRRSICFLTLLAAVSACSGDDDDAAAKDLSPATEATTTTSTTIPEFAPAPIAWQPCEDGLECAEVTVPVDYRQPTGATLALRVQRAPASDFTCGVEIAELYAPDYTIEDPTDSTALIDVSRRYADGCYAAAGELLSNIGTANAADDLDVVRAAMGDEQISYLGVSYGSLLGQMYAHQFPSRVRAMVIDGIVEPGPTGVDAGTQQTLGFERVLDAFAATCDAEPNCPLGGDTKGAVEQLIAQVEAEPLPVDGGQVGPGELSLALAVNLYGEAGWPDLSYAIEAGHDGDGELLFELAQDYMSLVDFDIYFSVFCMDYDWPEDPNELLAAGKAAGANAPHFGEALLNDYIRCSVWPVEEQPLPAVTAPGMPPILVVSTTNDPATPHDAAIRTAERLESAVLLTVEGDRHGAVSSGIPCVDEHVVNYLVNLAPPPEGIVCPTPE